MCSLAGLVHRRDQVGMGPMLRNLKMHWRRLWDVEEVSIRGVKICTAQSEIPRSVRSMLFKGTYETHECDLLERTVRSGERVLEIGAGIGLVGLIATRLCGEGNVLSCEANPDLELIIWKNYRLNGWVPNLMMRAVTSDGRDLPFFRSSNVLSSSALDRGLTGDKLVVESIAINDLIDRHRPSVVIMDVEGGETELLAAADLTRVRAIIVEMHSHIVGKEKIATLTKNTEAKGLRLTEVRHKTYLLMR